MRFRFILICFVLVSFGLYAQNPVKVMFGLHSAGEVEPQFIAQSQETLRSRWNSGGFETVWNESENLPDAARLCHEAARVGIPLAVFARVLVEGDQIRIVAALYHVSDFKEILSSESGGSMELGVAGKWAFISAKFIPAARAYPLVYPEIPPEPVEPEDPVLPVEPEKVVQPEEEPVEEADPAFSFSLGFETPIFYTVNFNTLQGNWHGLTQEAGLTVDYLRELSPALSIGGYLSLRYSLDYIYLPGDVFPADSRELNHSLTLSAGMRFMLTGWYMDAGVSMEWYALSQFRSPDLTENIESGGVPLGLSVDLASGYRFMLDQGWYIDLAVELSVAPLAQGAVPLRAGLVPRFGRILNRSDR